MNILTKKKKFHIFIYYKVKRKKYGISQEKT